MRAAVVEEPGQLVVREVPDLEPGAYDAVCEILYGATCSGTDTSILQGKFCFPVTYPTVLGHESIGRVTEVGAQVRNFAVGDLVTRVGYVPPPGAEGLSVTWGGFAERGLARDHRAMREDGRPEAEWIGSRWNQVLPPEFDPADSTLIITWRETLSYLQRMGVGEGARMLIIGSGGNALSYTGHAHQLGASEIVVVGSARRLETARRLGATATFDYAVADLPARLGQAFPRGFDFVMDVVGAEGSLDPFLPLVTPGGKVTIYGVRDFPRAGLHPHTAPGSFTFASEGYEESETHETIVQWVAEGRLDAKLFYDATRIFPLEEIGEAFAAVERREMVKAVIRMAD